MDFFSLLKRDLCFIYSMFYLLYVCQIHKETKEIGSRQQMVRQYRKMEMEMAAVSRVVPSTRPPGLKLYLADHKLTPPLSPRPPSRPSLPTVQASPSRSVVSRMAHQP